MVGGIKKLFQEDNILNLKSSNYGEKITMGEDMLCTFFTICSFCVGLWIYIYFDAYVYFLDLKGTDVTYTTNQCGNLGNEG